MAKKCVCGLPGQLAKQSRNTKRWGTARQRQAYRNYQKRLEELEKQGVPFFEALWIAAGEKY